MIRVGEMSSTATRSTALRMIEAQPVRDARAAVVAGEPEAREAQRAHQLDLVRRHRALRVVDVAGAAVGLRRIAVAAQVAADDGEALGEARRDPVPHRVRLRIAVQQQERRAAAADDAVDLRAGGRDLAASGIPETARRRPRSPAHDDHRSHLARADRAAPRATRRPARTSLPRRRPHQWISGSGVGAVPSRKSKSQPSLACVMCCW